MTDDVNPSTRRRFVTETTQGAGLANPRSHLGIAEKANMTGLAVIVTATALLAFRHVPAAKPLER